MFLFRLFSRTLLSLVLAGTAATAAAQEKLVLHHFLGPTTPTHAQFIVPWVERVEAAAGGALEIDIYPAMALGGTPRDLYRQLRDGTVDIAWTVVGYTPGVFPRSEVFELPSVHRGSARATNLAIADLYDQWLADDYADIHPLFVHTHAGNALHLISDADVNEMADLAGVKLRTPSRTGAWMIEQWHGEAIGMPLPALTQSLAKGVVEGALIPFEVVIPTQTDELTQFSIEGRWRFGTSVFLFAMNRDRYNALAPALRDIIDAHSRTHIAAQYGAMWDANEQLGIDAQVVSGGEIQKLSTDFLDDLDDAFLQVEQRWVDEANAADLGFRGEDLVRAAKDAIRKHSQ